MSSKLDNKTMKKGMEDLMNKMRKGNKPGSGVKPKGLDLSMFDKLPKKAAGGMMKKKGMAKGGMTKKGYKKGGKVRGVGIASKGFRPAKMVSMSKGGKKGGKK